MLAVNVFLSSLICLEVTFGIYGAVWPGECAHYLRLTDRVPTGLQLPGQFSHQSTEAHCAHVCTRLSHCGSYTYNTAPTSGWCVLYGISVQLVDDTPGTQGIFMDTDPNTNTYLYASKTCPYESLSERCFIEYVNQYPQVDNIHWSTIAYLQYEGLTAEACQSFCTWYSQCSCFTFLERLQLTSKLASTYNLLAGYGYCRLRQSITMKEIINGSQQGYVVHNTDQSKVYVTMDVFDDVTECT